MWGSRWHGSRIQHGHPGLVGMDSVSKDGVQGAALWTNPHVQATGGASRPLLSRPGGLWAWELGCGRGPSQPTPRAPRPERTCPSGPAESRNRRLIKGRCCAHNPFVSACGRGQPGRNTHKCLLVPPAHPPLPMHTPMCAWTTCCPLGRSSDSPLLSPPAATALSLILPCCMQRSVPCPGAGWAAPWAVSKQATAQPSADTRDPVCQPPSHGDKRFQDAGLST